MMNGVVLIPLLMFLSGQGMVRASGIPEGHPRIETTRERLLQVRTWLEEKKEPFHSYWKSVGPEIQRARQLKPGPSMSTDALQFHGVAQEQGIACRLLAYAWWLEGDEEAGKQAVGLLDAWASVSPLPGTCLDPKVRYPNSGMDVARGMLPFIAACDLLKSHPAMTDVVEERIHGWFRALVPVVREGIRRWEENDDFGKQEFQNHHVSHVLGLVLLGVALDDKKLIRFAVDSPENPKDFKELIAGMILMPGEAPHGGLRGKPLHAGEIQDRYRTTSGAGLVYCHLSLTLMMYSADVLTRVTGEDYLNWKAPGGECLKLSATFYSDFFRTRNVHLHGDYYFRDEPMMRNVAPFMGIWEVALANWPDVPNLKAVVRKMDRKRVPRSWLCYYGLPLLTHGVENP